MHKDPTPVQSTAVVGIDFQPRSTGALQHALSMFAHGIVHEVHLVHVVENEAVPSRARLEKLTDFTVSLARASTGISRRRAFAHTKAGRAREEIVQLAHDVGATMIVLGDRSDGRAIDASLFAPFSLMQAGETLSMECRPHRTPSKCQECTHIRDRVAGTEMFCVRHARKDRVSKRISVSPRVGLALH